MSTGLVRKAINVGFIRQVDGKPCIIFSSMPRLVEMMGHALFGIPSCYAYNRYNLYRFASIVTTEGKTNFMPVPEVSVFYQHLGIL